jgi:hypothetical protein
MNLKIGTISIHLIAWVLLFMIPFLSTYQVIKSFAGESESLPMIPMIILSLTLIGIFYLNYFFLIPRYLLKKKYVKYILYFIMAIGCSIIISSIIFTIAGVDPAEIDKNNPVVNKIGPIAKANAFLMLGVATIASIALALNKRIKEIEQENHTSQISMLKYQINPHFLFNTLNNIYATSIIDNSPKTAEMIEKLSSMMRYTMKDTQNDYVSLENEFDYITNFIELQKIRLDENIKLILEIQKCEADLKIAPMLLIPFIENAFKHGVNPEEKSEIKIELSVKSKILYLAISNNIVNHQNSIVEKSGLGIANTKKRLELIYPSSYELVFKTDKNIFNVFLKVDLA